MSIFSVLCRASSHLAGSGTVFLPAVNHAVIGKVKKSCSALLCALKHCCLQIVISRLARFYSFAPLAVLLMCLESLCSSEEAATARSLTTECALLQSRTCSEEGKIEVNAWKRNVLALLGHCQGVIGHVGTEQSHSEEAECSFSQDAPPEMR